MLLSPIVRNSSNFGYTNVPPSILPPPEYSKGTHTCVVYPTVSDLPGQVAEFVIPRVQCVVDILLFPLVLQSGLKNLQIAYKAMQMIKNMSEPYYVPTGSLIPSF